MIENQDYAMHPGEYLGKVLEDRGIARDTFAKQIDMDINDLNDIISANMAVVHAIAVKLDAALRIPTATWVRLQYDYDRFVPLRKPT